MSGGLTAKNARYVLETAGEDDGAEMAGLALMVPSVKKGGSLFRGEYGLI